jgi:hypothetical protein
MRLRCRGNRLAQQDKAGSRFGLMAGGRTISAQGDVQGHEQIPEAAEQGNARTYFQARFQTNPPFTAELNAAL